MAVAKNYKLKYSGKQLEEAVENALRTATGGEAAHTLTVEERPRHQHSIKNPTGDGTAVKFGANAGDTNYSLIKKTATYDFGMLTNETGGGSAHNNMPPYIAVYAWKRTA